MEHSLDDDLLDRYFYLAETALAEARDAAVVSRDAEVQDTIQLASAYIDDAHHFRKHGEHLLAYGALNFAHGLLDGLVRTGLVNACNPDVFTQDEP